MTNELLARIDILNNENKQLKKLCNKYEEEHKKEFNTWLQGQKVLVELEEWLKDSKDGCILNQEYDEGIVYLVKEDDYNECLYKIQELKEKYSVGDKENE